MNEVEIFQVKNTAIELKEGRNEITRSYLLNEKEILVKLVKHFIFEDIL